ncbi:MAG: hypothetical protein IH946_07590, partial [Bacteroidetes bacterium]|nr:hypothetical protein [Bacteroidota bacterium]
ILLNLYILFNPVIPFEKHLSPYNQLLFNLISVVPGDGRIVYFLLTITLILMQALLINSYINNYKITDKSTYLPALVYVVLSSVFFEFSQASPVLFANTFLVIALGRLISIYNKPQCYQQVFDIGLLISVATLFFLPAIFFLVILFPSLMILRTFKWREWIITLIGFATPYFLTATYFFVNGTLMNFLNQHLGSWTLEQGHVFNPNPGFWIKVGILMLILLLTANQVHRNFFKNTIRNRKYFNILTVYLFVAFSTFFIDADSGLYYLAMILPPLSIVISYGYTELNRPILGEALNLLLVLAIIYFQYSIFMP